MRRTIGTSALLAMSMALSFAAAAQQPEPATPPPEWMNNIHAKSAEVGITLDFERIRAVGPNNYWAWLKGAALDGSLTFYRGLGVAANFTGDHTSNVSNGVGLGKISFMAGPRYTVDVARYLPTSAKKHPAFVFGEYLFGGAHAFGSLFPQQNGTVTTAGTFSTQLGGGVDLALKDGFYARPVEMDWVHTALPNTAGNSQNDFRIAWGVSSRR
jgi:hypothetical protein